ncbi:sulfatase [Bacteroidota bacterium]
MNIRSASTGLVIISNVLFSCQTDKENNEKPNVLFICIDDLRPELACYGNEIIKSPYLDGLANEGCLFNNHFANAPTSGASRYSLLTGKHPKTRSHISNEAIRTFISNREESENSESFIHQLRRNGYYTVGIGKISHYPDGYLYGYNDTIGTELELPNSWDEMLFDPGKWKTGWNSFFGYSNGENRQSMKKQVKPYECSEVEDDGYVDGLTANLALLKLKELSKTKQPFFLGVGFFKPHLPFTAPKKYWDMYDEDNIPLTSSNFIPENINKASLHASGEFNQYQAGEEKASLEKAVSDNYARKIKHAYYACVSYVDNQVGKLIKELKELGLYKNTIIVVWGDHGWHLGDKLVWGKHTIFEKALRSTLIIKSAETNKQSIKSDQVVSTVDIYPTLMELCGIETPENIDGSSFVKIMKHGYDQEWKNIAYGYYKNGISLRTGEYRLTKYFRKEMPNIELYDHAKKHLENINIAKENPDIVKKLMPVWEKGNTGLFEK